MTEAHTVPLAEFCALVRTVLSDGSCRRVVLCRRRSGAVEHPELLRVRPVVLRAELQYQFAAVRSGREFHENLPAAEAAARIEQLFGPAYRRCHLFTAAGDYDARLQGDGRVRFKLSPPSLLQVETLHDRPKRYLLPEGVPCAFLQAIGVMTADGRVRKEKRHKFRQINRFLELVEDAVPALPPAGPLRVVDFGSGKSYLTFALHHLLREIHGRDVRLTGLDRNAEVLRDCAEIAARLHCAGLEFRVGDISRFDPGERVHLAVSLHACDTATDDALAQAVRWNAEVILAVPCCQHELGPQLQCPALAAVLSHGLLRERFAALVTDALRAAALEICGYKTQVVEFIDLEHTAKNVLIRAVRRPVVDAAVIERQVEAYRALKQLVELGDVYLESALGPEFCERVHIRPHL